MRIVNGGRDLSAATSGTVTLNGVVLARPAEFKKKQTIVDLPIALTENNLLTVELNGEPGTTIAILVRPR